jgi:hypothetical protein
MNPAIDITDELLAWHAMRRPGETSYCARADIPAYQSSAVMDIASLEALLGNRFLDAAKIHAALEVATELKWRETQVICHHLWGSEIEKVWTMDEAFVKLFRKGELLHLAELHQLQAPEGKAWDKLNLAELRTEILARANQMKKPKILQQLYADIAEPYVPWSERNRDELDDECEY